MAVDLEPCLVHTAGGELLARGFVRERDESSLVVEAKTFAGTWLRPGDPAVVQILSAARGRMTYDAVVAFSAPRRIGLVDLRLRSVVEQRAALRVPTAIPMQISHVLDGDVPVAVEPFEILVIDLSVGGMRLSSAARLALGTRLAMVFTATDRPIDLTVEVLRVEEIRGGFAYGCRFEDATEREHDALFRFVESAQRRQAAERARPS
ncbi:MAG TPA: PilZ domain-containing protein [Actinotalea sp.]|nr:PilZ domain-containing protein [Actinotalea sp.]